MASKRKLIDLTADDSDEAAPDLAQLHREREARQPWRLRRPGVSWTGKAQYDDDAVQKLRERLKRTNHGSPGLEVLRPGEERSTGSTNIRMRGNSSGQREHCTHLAGPAGADRQTKLAARLMHLSAKSHTETETKNTARYGKILFYH